MQPSPPDVSLGKLARAGASSALRAPFRTLLLVELLITLVAATIPEGATDAAALVGGLVLALVSALLQIAIVLAAAHHEPDGSADPWIVAAVRARCFWRFALTRVLITVMILLGVALVVLLTSRLPLGWVTFLGLVAALVWGFAIGSVIGVAEQAAVLERRWPFDAMGRSAILTRPSRRAIGALFAAAIVAPSFLADRLLGVDLLGSLGILKVVPSLVAIVVSTAGLIALTKAYIDLGGSDQQPVRGRRA